MPVITPTGGGGGGGSLAPIEDDFSGTTGGTPTYQLVHVFDLGGVAAAQLLFDITGLHGDGETFGNTNPGEIAVYFLDVQSLDGITYVAPTLSPGFIPGQAATITDLLFGIGAVQRYQKVTAYIGWGEGDPNAGDVYTGPHSPTADLSYKLSYR